MEALFLGTGTIFPDPERRAPALAIVHDTTVLLIDTGPGTWYRLAEAGIDYRDLGAVLYTHIHLDHILDLPALLFLAHNPEYALKRDLRLIAPEGFEPFLGGLKNIFGKWMEPRGGNLDLTLLPRPVRSLSIGGVSIKAAPVRHHETSTAYRFEAGGKSLVVSGDVEYCSEIVELARGADLLVTESAHPEGTGYQGHLTPSLAGRIAAEAGVKKLALTHFYPDCAGHDMAAPAKAVFGGEVVIAQDLMKITA